MDEPQDHGLIARVETPKHNHHEKKGKVVDGKNKITHMTTDRKQIAEHHECCDSHLNFFQKCHKRCKKENKAMSRMAMFQTKGPELKNFEPRNPESNAVGAVIKRSLKLILIIVLTIGFTTEVLFKYVDKLGTIKRQ